MSKTSIIYVDVTKEMSDYVESLMYETNARKDMVAYMIDHDMTKNDAYDRYHKDYVEYHTKYEMAKRELEATYVHPLKLGNVKWTMNFRTHQLEVEVTDDGNAEKAEV